MFADMIHSLGLPATLSEERQDCSCTVGS